MRERERKAKKKLQKQNSPDDICPLGSSKSIQKQNITKQNKTKSKYSLVYSKYFPTICHRLP